MTREQLDALEGWIVAIIRREDRAADTYDAVHCYRVREAVETAFGLQEQEQ